MQPSAQRLAIAFMLLAGCIGLTMSSCTVGEALTQPPSEAATGPQDAAPTAATVVSPSAETLVARGTTEKVGGTDTAVSTTPVPSATLRATLLPATAFKPGSLAAGLAGSPDCQLPCWLGLTLGVSNEANARAWLDSLGLTPRFEIEQQSDTGVIMRAENVNPDDVWAHQARRMYLTVHRNRAAMIELYGVPLLGDATEEIQGLVLLLGSPEAILLEPILGEDALGYSLRLAYPSRGLEVQFSGVADQAEVDGKVQDALCLARHPEWKADVLIFDTTYHSLSASDLNWDWAMRFGVEETELLGWMLDPERCLPIP